VELFAVRGANPTIVTASEDGPTVLLIDPGLDYETYRVTFTRGTDASPVFSLDGQEPEIFDMLAITFPPGTLEAGNYEVVIEGQDAGRSEEIARLMFRVVF